MIGKLCDNGCLAIFDKKTLNILKNQQMILKVDTNLRDGLWDIPFQEHTIDSINYIIIRDKNKSELAQYLHAYDFSLVISTFQKSIIRWNVVTWSGINNLNLNNTWHNQSSIERISWSRKQKFTKYEATNTSKVYPNRCS